MSVAFRRLGSNSVNLVIMRGRVDRDSLLDLWRGIDSEDPANTLPWIMYLSSDVDTSEIDIAAYAELNRILTPIRDRAAEKKNYTAVMVSNSEGGDAWIEFWREFVSRESKHPPYTILFSNVRHACKSLNLPNSAEGAIEDAIRAHRAAHAADARGPETRGPDDAGRFSADRH